MKKKILIGFIGDGTAGGVDKYIIGVYESIRSDNVQIDFLSNIVNNPLIEEFSKYGSKIYAVATLAHPLKQFLQVREIVKKNAYDIVYINASTSLTFPVCLAAKVAGAKRIIVHSHSSGFDEVNKYKRVLFTFLHRICKGLISCCATDYLTCSDKASEWMFSKRIIKNDKVIFIQNTANLQKFKYDENVRNKIRAEYGIENKFVVGNVANMLYCKNHRFLLEVFAHIYKADQNAHLVLIGDGILRDDIEKEIETLGLKEHVSLLGKVDASKGFMSAFDVFVLPSFFEGLPIVAVEAQCSKLPCVISDTITTQAKIGNMCKFVSVNDSREFANAVLSFKGTDRTEYEIFGDIRSFATESQSKIIKSIFCLD